MKRGPSDARWLNRYEGTRQQRLDGLWRSAYWKPENATTPVEAPNQHGNRTGYHSRRSVACVTETRLMRGRTPLKPMASPTEWERECHGTDEL